MDLASYFAEEDEEIASSYLVWGGIAVYYAEMYVGLRQQRNLNDFLLDVIKSLFKDINVDKVVTRIMGYAKQLVNADRAALFMIDGEDLYAQLFDHGQGPGETTGGSQEIRFPKTKGIAGYVVVVVVVVVAVAERCVMVLWLLWFWLLLLFWLLLFWLS